MKTIKSTFIVLFVLLTAQIGSAYYCPATGRWINRDPIGEPGFRMSCLKSPKVGGEFTPKRRLPDGNEIVFVQNTPIDEYDINGLLSPGTCVRGTVVVAKGAAGVAAAIAALPVEAVVAGVVIVGEVAVITYTLCKAPKCDQYDYCELHGTIHEEPVGKPGDTDYTPGFTICVYKCPKLGFVERKFPEGHKCGSAIIQPWP